MGSAARAEGKHGKCGDQEWEDDKISKFWMSFDRDSHPFTPVSVYIHYCVNFELMNRIKKRVWRSVIDTMASQQKSEPSSKGC